MLEWTEVCNTDGYVFVYGPHNKTANITGETYTLIDLPFFTEYNITIAASNRYGTGPFSDPVTVRQGTCMKSVL